MSDCVFCPDNWPNLRMVPEGDEYANGYLVITPLNPVTDGHVLVVGDHHFAHAAVDTHEAAELMYVAAEYVKAQKIEANIITSIGPAATQTVRHTHVHVVPRRMGDGLHLPWTGQVSS